MSCLIGYSLAKKTVNFAVVGHDIYDNMYKMIEDGFNEYSNTNKLDIELKITKFTESNTTLGRISFDSSINSLIESGSSDYDMYIFDPIYTKKYATHFADLKNLVPPEHMSLYTSSENVAKVGLFKDQWVGLVSIIDFKLKIIHKKNNNNNICYNNNINDNNNNNTKNNDDFFFIYIMIKKFLLY